MGTSIVDVLVQILKIFVWIIIGDALCMSIPIIRWKRKGDYPEKFQINTTNQIHYQGRNQCAAYASAYVLRHFQIQKDGDSLYKELLFKFPSGNVTPLGIRILFWRYGFKTKYYKGNIETLKQEIEKGTPVIVFVHANQKSKGRHFVPVTGYDSKGFYLAESLENHRNLSDVNGRYNRKVTYDEFKKMWDIKTFYMPFYSNTYITISRR